MVDGTGKNEGLIEIEVAYANPDEQVIVTINVPQDTTAGQAVVLSGLLERFPEINASELKIGVFGAVCKPEQTVKQDDRLEIYRALRHDPKDARRQRAIQKR
ncbi:MAG: RnfH family protein [Methyloglobulus sp.]|nr:RnfH family protein [Methyloglobulus sp.]